MTTVLTTKALLDAASNPGMEYPIIWSIYFYGLIVVVMFLMFIFFKAGRIIAKKLGKMPVQPNRPQIKYALIAFLTFIILHFQSISNYDLPYSFSYTSTFIQLHGFWLAAVTAIIASGIAPFLGAKND